MRIEGRCCSNMLCNFGARNCNTMSRIMGDRHRDTISWNMGASFCDMKATRSCTSSWFRALFGDCKLTYEEPDSLSEEVSNPSGWSKILVNRYFNKRAFLWLTRIWTILLSTAEQQTVQLHPAHPSFKHGLECIIICDVNSLLRVYPRCSVRSAVVVIQIRFVSETAAAYITLFRLYMYPSDMAPDSININMCVETHDVSTYLGLRATYLILWGSVYPTFWQFWYFVGSCL
jgi:hypothetical protein